LGVGRGAITPKSAVTKPPEPVEEAKTHTRLQLLCRRKYIMISTVWNRLYARYAFKENLLL
jgi:hypothetical protein